MNILEILVLLIFYFYSIWIINLFVGTISEYSKLLYKFEESFYSGRFVLKYFTEDSTYYNIVPCNLTSEFFNISKNYSTLVKEMEVKAFNLYYVNLTDNRTHFIVNKSPRFLIEFRRLCKYNNELIIVGVQV